MRLHSALITIGTCLTCILPACAQKGDTPSNMGHFYMARQQVQIIDDSPIIQHKQGDPGAAASGNGGMPTGGPMPLPRAGWQPYSSSMPSPSASLPKVINGVPPKPVATPMPKANKGKAGAVKPVAPYVPPTAKSYSSYHTAGGPGTSGGGNVTTSTAVRGSVLGNMRGRRRGF